MENVDEVGVDGTLTHLREKLAEVTEQKLKIEQELNTLKDQMKQLKNNLVNTWFLLNSMA